MKSEAMTYRLLAVTPDGRGPDCEIGSFPTFDDALRARDRDAVRQLTESGGWYRVIEHLIVGPGLAGAATVHRVAMGVGVDPARFEPPGQSDMDRLDWWLSSIHA